MDYDNSEHGIGCLFLIGAVLLVLVIGLTGGKCVTTSLVLVPVLLRLYYGQM